MKDSRQSGRWLCPRFILLGDANLDVSLTIAELPVAGGEAVATNQLTSPGGSASNTAKILARLGVAADLIAMVGADLLAEIILNELETAGVGTGLVGRSSEHGTPVNFVVVSTGGERTMFSFRGSSVHLAAEDVQPSRWPVNVSAIHISGYSLLAPPQSEAAEIAMEHAWLNHIPILFDVPAILAEAGRSSILRSSLPRIDTLVVDPAHLCNVTGATSMEAAVSQVLAAGISTLALKLGAKGCRVISRDGLDRVIPAVVVDSVDTTGAGDAFCAGMLMASARKLDAASGALLGNILGACVVEARGAATHTISSRSVFNMVKRVAIDSGAELSQHVARVLALMREIERCEHNSCRPEVVADAVISAT